MKVQAAALVVAVLFYSLSGMGDEIVTHQKSTTPEKYSAGTPAESVALDPSLKPENPDEYADVYKDMGVVQRKAMKKKGSFLISAYGSFDFSDGPYTMYSLNVNPGYALSDTWEVYLNYAPVFFVSPRQIVSKIESLTLANGQQAGVDAPRPTTAFGAEILWAPMYGKDSFGLRAIVRSDTFLKLGVSDILYDGGGNGLRFILGFGKTFFLGPKCGLRLTVDGGDVQTILDNVKSFQLMALIETGFVFYL
jgi:hypothetical protein